MRTLKLTEEQYNKAKDQVALGVMYTRIEKNIGVSYETIKKIECTKDYADFLRQKAAMEAMVRQKLSANGKKNGSRNLPSVRLTTMKSKLLEKVKEIQTILDQI